MLQVIEVPRPMGRPPSNASSVSVPIVFSPQPEPQPAEDSKLGKQPLPRELAWEIYKEQVLDNHITEAVLGESEDDLTSGPYTQGKAKFNDVLHELLAINFARTRLEGTGRPSTDDSSSMRTIKSVVTAEGSGSKRNTQDTMLTLPPEVSDAIENAETDAGQGSTEAEETKESPVEEIERPASRASIASDSSDGSDISYLDPNRPHIVGPIHAWLPAMHRTVYLTKRQKIKRAIWKIKTAPQNMTVSVKKAVMGEEPWSQSPYFLVDEYTTPESKGLKEKLKFEFKEPDMNTTAGKLYARACEPYFRNPGTTKRECASCTEMFNVTDVTTLDCSHRYCEECLRTMIMMASQQESTMPPSCCKRAVQPNVIKRTLKTEEDRIAFSRKVIEYDTSIDKRLFCPRKKCGSFIPYHPRKDQEHPLVGTCQKCGTRACRICKGKAHSHDVDCPKDMDLTAVLDLSQMNGWKRCFRCRTMIELNYGCRHMTCRCGAEFCYLCGGEWSYATGCPTGCDQVEDGFVLIATHVAEAERLAAEAAEAAANDPEVQERLRQEEEARLEEELKLKRTIEDFKIKALLRTQKDEQDIFNVYSDSVILKLKNRHYEEMTDLQLEHVSEFLGHNSELEDRTIEFSQTTQIEEREFCEKLGMTPEEVKRSPHEEEYATLSLRHRQQMLQMKAAWDKEHQALKYNQAKGIDKLRSKQDLEERVVYVELEERKTNFVTEQRNALAKMLEFRRIATGEEFSGAEAVYTTGDLKLKDQEEAEEDVLEGVVTLLEELAARPHTAS